MARRNAYDWRDADDQFRADWDDAVESATDRLEAEARRRAFEGVRKYVVSRGMIVQSPEGGPLEIHEYSDTLMVRLLQAHRPAFRERTDINLSGKVSLVDLVQNARKPAEGQS